MMAVFDRLRRDEGQDLVEYALLISLISIVSMIALLKLSVKMRFLWWVLAFVLNTKN